MSAEIVWLDNLSNARLKAEKCRKPIFIDWADLPRCVGCVSLENNTYPEKNVIDFVSENFVPVQLNQRQNLDFFRQHKIIWTPTVSICDVNARSR